MTRVLVTGATGFLGRPLVDQLLAEGFHVTGLARTMDQVKAPLPPNAVSIAVDLTNPDNTATTLAGFPWDAVVNLAPGKTDDNLDDPRLVGWNVGVAKNLLAAIGSRPVKLIHLSSMMVHMPTARASVTEADPCTPGYEYGRAKLLADELVLAAPGNVDASILRIPGLFSASRRAGALYRFARAAITGEPLLINATTPVSWDILDVRDAATAIVRALRSPVRRPGIVNVSYGEPVELVAIAERVAKLGGKGSVCTNETGVVHPSFHLDSARVRRIFEWPPATLSERLAELVRAVAAAP